MSVRFDLPAEGDAVLIIRALRIAANRAPASLTIEDRLRAKRLATEIETAVHHSRLDRRAGLREVS